MIRTATARRIGIAALLAALCLPLFFACTSQTPGPSPREQIAPSALVPAPTAPPATEPPSPAPTATPAGAETPSAEQIPQSTGQETPPAEPIEVIVIKHAPAWNEFARDYNEHPERYAKTMTVEIDARLDFTHLAFVPLTGRFAGTIRGTMAVEGYTAVKTEHMRHLVNFDLSGYGFCNISAVEEVTGEAVYVYSREEGLRFPLKGAAKTEGYAEGGGERVKTPLGLFGARCGTLNLENLCFENVRVREHLIAQSVDSLSLRNIEAVNCTTEDGALFADNMGSLTVENMLVSRCSMTLDVCGGGLFNWVEGDADFRLLGILNTAFTLLPEGGSSGFSAGSTAMLVTHAGGKVSFSDIELYQCSGYSLSSVALCHTYRELADCSDIEVRSCSFLGIPVEESPLASFPQNAMLFGNSYTPQDPVVQNVLLKDSMFNIDGGPDDYRSESFIIENCLDVDKEARLP